MRRINFLMAMLLVGIITLASAQAFAQENDGRGWGARRSLAGRTPGRVETEPETEATAAPTGSDILDVIERDKEARRRALEGAWRISVAKSNTGLAPFNALHVFHQGGTFTEVSDLLSGLAEMPANSEPFKERCG